MLYFNLLFFTVITLIAFINYRVLLVYLHAMILSFIFINIVIASFLKKKINLAYIAYILYLFFVLTYVFWGLATYKIEWLISIFNFFNFWFTYIFNFNEIVYNIQIIYTFVSTTLF